MTDYAWVSQAPSDTRLGKKIWSDLAIEYSSSSERSAELEERRNNATSVANRNVRGAILMPEEFPPRMSGYSAPTESRRTYKKLPHFFHGGSWCVSAECAAVLRQFDLAGGLYPVEIYQEDRKTRVPGEYFHLNVGCAKDAVLPGASPGLADIFGNGGLTFVNSPNKDDDVGLSTVALSGPVIWVDPTLVSRLFFSDRLWAAMKAAKVHGPFRAKRCPIVSD